MVLAIFKGVIFSAVITWLVALFIGSSGSTGAQLAVHRIHFEQASFYWSWPVFIALAVVFGAITWLMDS